MCGASKLQLSHPLNNWNYIPPSAKISFANVHRLPKHKSALQPSNATSSQTPAIVVKFVKIQDKIIDFKTGNKSKTVSKEYYKTSARVHAGTAQSPSKESFQTIYFGEKDKMENWRCGLLPLCWRWEGIGRLVLIIKMALNSTIFSVLHVDARSVLAHNNTTKLDEMELLATMHILPIRDYYLLLLNLFEVFQVLNSLNPNKCKGFDNLPNRILNL